MRRPGRIGERRARTALSRRPRNVTPPTLSASSFLIGDAITVTAGTWEGSPTLTYQWQLDDVDISGATGTAHTARTEDVIGLLSVLEIPDGDRSLAVRSAAIALRGTTLLVNHLGWWLDENGTGVRLVRNRVRTGETIADWQRGYFSQPVPARYPQRTTRNGFPALLFSPGSAQALYQGIVGAADKGNVRSFFDATTQQHTIVCDFVASSVANTNGAHESFHGSVVQKTWGMGPFGTTSTRWYGYRFQNSVGIWAIANVGPNAYTLGSVETGIGWYDGIMIGCRVGSTETTTVATGVTSDVSYLTLGRYYVASGSPIDYDGEILRYHVLDRALSLAERQAMRAASQARFMTGAAYTGTPVTKPVATDPATIAGCTAIYDETGLDPEAALGSPCNQWTSRVAGAPPLLADAADTTRPTFDEYNGRRCLVFARASSQRLRSGSTTALSQLLGTSSYTVFIVHRDPVGDGQGSGIQTGASVISSDTVNGLGFAAGIHYQAGGADTDRDGSFHKNSGNTNGFTFFTHQAAVPVHADVVRVSWTRFDASDGRLATRFAHTLDWITGCTALESAAANARIVIGRRGDTANFWNGRIFEIVAYNRALSMSEIERVEQYLYQRWT